MGTSWQENPLCCARCGTPEIEVQMWAKPYKKEIDWGQDLPWEVYDTPEESGVNAFFCDACGLDCGVLLASEAVAVFHLLAVLGEAA